MLTFSVGQTFLSVIEAMSADVRICRIDSNQARRMNTSTLADSMADRNVRPTGKSHIPTPRHEYRPITPIVCYNLTMGRLGRRPFNFAAMIWLLVGLAFLAIWLGIY
jgi:hypothetical protein